MIDLETWGKRASSGMAIRSIGAACFDPFARAHVHDSAKEFYVNVDRASCESVGLVIDPETEKWWDQQSQAARDALLDAPTPLPEALRMFVAFWLKVGGQYPWSQGANFDQPILEEALHRCGMRPPWKFWDSRCTRTAYGIAGFNPNTVKRAGVAHNALQDCKHQIVCVQRAMSYVTVNELRRIY